MTSKNEGILRATHGSSKKTHILGEIEFDCYVLEDGTAVLSGRGMQRVLGIGDRETHGSKLAGLLAQTSLNPFISSELARDFANPLRFIRPGRGGTPARGYEATTLTKICRAILAARRENVMKNNVLFQQIAHQSELIVSAFSDAGIVAYVYEVTGYEKIKDPNVIRSIVDGYLAKEIRKWTKEYPDELFIQMDKIYGNEKTTSRNRPLYYANFIRKYIYKPLLSGKLLKRLDVENPIKESVNDGKIPYRKNRHHSLTSLVLGLPTLKSQIWQVIAVLKVSPSKRIFDNNFNKMMGNTIQTELFDDIEE